MGGGSSLNDANGPDDEPVLSFLVRPTVYLNTAHHQTLQSYIHAQQYGGMHVVATLAT